MPDAARPPERSPRAQLAVPGALAVLDVPAVRRWALLTRSVFAARRVEIDALNVFPVPDGDTGTNLFLTFDGGVERMLAHDPHGEAPVRMEVALGVDGARYARLWADTLLGRVGER